MDVKDKSGNLTYKIGFGILISIVGFFAVQQMNKLTQIEKNLVQIQKDIVQIQSNILTRSEVKAIVKDEIEKFFYQKYNKKGNKDE